MNRAQVFSYGRNLLPALSQAINGGENEAEVDMLREAEDRKLIEANMAKM